MVQFYYMIEQIHSLIVQLSCKTLTNEEYILAFAHELCHLKGWSSNERYTSYLTFIKLYNSEFKDIALKFAVDMNNGCYPFEYNCYGQIEKYLIRRNYE